MKTLLLILALVPCAVTVLADEPKPSVLDAHALLSQTELNVLIRQYEKVLTEFYEMQFQLQLMTVIGEQENIPKEETERRAENIKLRMKAMAERRDEIRVRILRLAEEQNLREKERQGREQKAAATPEKKAASPSERAPAPKF